MLYISRRIGEPILIDGKIEVVLHQISGKQVKLGVLAPKNTSVYRKELLEKILEENKMAYEAARNLFVSDDKTDEKEEKNPMSELRNKLSTLNSLLHKSIIEVKRGDTININSIFKIMADIEPILLGNDDPIVKDIVDGLVEKYDELIMEIRKKQQDLDDELTKLRNNMKGNRVYGNE